MFSGSNIGKGQSIVPDIQAIDIKLTGKFSIRIFT